MFKKALFILLPLSLFLAGCSTVETTFEVSEPSQFQDTGFVFEEMEHDFGVIKQSGGKVNYEFKFKYEGEEPIKVVSTPSSCMCTEAEISKKEFKPGDEGVLRVIFNPNLHAEPEGRFFKTASIITEPELEKMPEVKIWVEIDLDLGEEAFELQQPHNDSHDLGKKISHDGSVVGLAKSNKKVLEIESTEVTGELADGLKYNYWTYNNTVPGEFFRVKEGDEVVVKFKNSSESQNPHSVDFHSVNGPGGGAAVLTANPGESKEYTFKATHPGAYVYHCATPVVSHHMANGMYGLIVVEPKEGLPKVDREFYVMQGEFYTNLEFGQKGLAGLSGKKVHEEMPDYIVFNGATNSLVGEKALEAKVGEKVRMFVGNGGVSKVSSFHVIGEIFDQVYPEGGTPIRHNVQTTVVPAGGATIVEFVLDEPGVYKIVDHALSRLDKGAMAELVVSE